MSTQKLGLNQFPELLSAIRGFGYEIIGPTRRDQAIVYDIIDSVADLPRGWIDVQAPGSYRLQKQGDAYFAHTVGPQSWKKFFLPPKRRIFSSVETKKGVQFSGNTDQPRKQALLGVRACEIAAIQVQDKVLMSGPAQDSYYAQARKNSLIIAVQCTRATDMCFCVSTQTGPTAKSGFDIALTEVIDRQDHYFLLRAESEKGLAILQTLPLTLATKQEQAAATEAQSQAAKQKQQMPLSEIRDVLPKSLHSERWEKIATQCLSCANCTLACPTCFCTNVTDTTDLTGNHAERWKTWDSCFNADFSYIHGGSVRVSTKSKYRQWMTHKLSSWWEQFGSSGCVGCGRCVTWCPVGIDIVAEAQGFVTDAAKGEKNDFP